MHQRHHTPQETTGQTTFQSGYIRRQHVVVLRDWYEMFKKSSNCVEIYCDMSNNHILFLRIDMKYLV